jgi:hypothetical protein
MIMDELSGEKTAFRRFVERIVDVASEYPFVVLGLAIALIVGNGFIAKHLEIRSDFLDLLPKNSKGYQAFIHQQGRVGGGASLYVVVKSPVRAANERFIDDISAALAKEGDTKRTCQAACGADATCKAACGRPMVAYVEGGTKDLRAFFQRNRWLYATQEDLEKADEELDHKIAKQSGLVDDLSDDAPAEKGPASAGTGSPPKPDTTLADLEAKSDAAYKKYDDYPSGYFATEKGDEFAMRIVATTASLGDKLGDELFSFTEGEVARLKREDAARPASEQRYPKDIVVGVGGDIANAVAEKKSIVSEAAGAVLISFAAILLGIVFYFRRISALGVVFLPAFIGVSSAYAFATATFGYVNTAGAFLGAIILGNGINYPIVLYGRYLEFRARGMSPAEARRGAVWNAFRAELVGALVAGIAYGSLTVTSFRGFSQFGTIGFVGMLFVWLSIIPVVPALVVINERMGAFVKAKFGVDLADGLLSKVPGLGPQTHKVSADPAAEKYGLFVDSIANVTAKAPRLFVALAAVVVVGAAFVLPKYLKDPWEYDLSRLGSDAAQKKGGSSTWTDDANRIFGGRANLPGVLVLADSVEQVPLVKKKILENDKKFELPFIADVKTVADFLPGTPTAQKAKLEVVDRIRDRLTPKVLESLTPEDRARAERLMPPEDLKPLTGADLPPLIRRRFEELNGSVGTVMYVSFTRHPRLRMGQDLIRIAETCDNLTLDDGTFVQTASTFTVRAELVKSMAHDGPIATFASFFAVLVVIAFSTGSFRGFSAVLAALLLGVVVTVAGAALVDMRLNFINFIALPITFGIGVEYPFNLFDRSRLLGGDITLAMKRSAGAVILCSFTTTVGYGSLIFSDQRALKSFGKLAMSGEIGCIIAALFFLPSLLRLWPQRKADAVRTAD